MIIPTWNDGVSSYPPSPNIAVSAIPWLAFGTLLALSVNSVLQPSGTICGLSAKYRILRASAFFCVLDVLNVFWRCCVCRWNMKRGWVECIDIVLSHKFIDDNIYRKGVMKNSGRNTMLRWIFGAVLVGSCFMIFDGRNNFERGGDGFVWVKIYAGMWMASWWIGEIMILFSRKSRHGPAPTIPDLETRTMESQAYVRETLEPDFSQGGKNSLFIAAGLHAALMFCLLVDLWPMQSQRGEGGLMREICVKACILALEGWCLLSSWTMVAFVRSLEGNSVKLPGSGYGWMAPTFAEGMLVAVGLFLLYFCPVWILFWGVGISKVSIDLLVFTVMAGMGGATYAGCLELLNRSRKTAKSLGLVEDGKDGRPPLDAVGFWSVVMAVYTFLLLGTWFVVKFDPVGRGKSGGISGLGIGN